MALAGGAGGDAPASGAGSYHHNILDVFKDHKAVSLLGLIAFLLVAYYLRERSAASSAASASAATPTTADAAGTADDGSGAVYGGDGSSDDGTDPLDQLTSQLGDLLTSQTQGQATNAAALNTLATDITGLKLTVPTTAGATTSPAKIKGALAAPKLPVGGSGFHPAPPAATYTVKAGDNLTSIAKAHGISEASLYSTNKAAIGSNPNLIRPGQRLTL
jgi:LysM repeat protein